MLTATFHRLRLHLDRHVTRARWPRVTTQRCRHGPPPTNFAHNVRVAFVCAPALLLVLDVSGGSIAGIVAPHDADLHLQRAGLAVSSLPSGSCRHPRLPARCRRARGPRRHPPRPRARRAGRLRRTARVWATLNLEWFVARSPPSRICSSGCSSPRSVRAAPRLRRRRARRASAAGGAARLIAACPPAAGGSRAPLAARRRRAAPPPPCAPAVAAAHAIAAGPRRRATPRCTRPLARGDPRRRCWRCPRSPRWWWRRRRRRASAASMSAALAPS